MFSCNKVWWNLIKIFRWHVASVFGFTYFSYLITMNMWILCCIINTCGSFLFTFYCIIHFTVSDCSIIMHQYFCISQAIPLLMPLGDGNRLSDYLDDASIGSKCCAHCIGSGPHIFIKHRPTRTRITPCAHQEQSRGAATKRLLLVGKCSTTNQLFLKLFSMRSEAYIELWEILYYWRNAYMERRKTQTRASTIWCGVGVPNVYLWVTAYSG